MVWSLDVVSRIGHWHRFVVGVIWREHEIENTKSVRDKKIEIIRD